MNKAMQLSRKQMLLVLIWLGSFSVLLYLFLPIWASNEYSTIDHLEPTTKSYDFLVPFLIFWLLSFLLVSRHAHKKSMGSSIGSGMLLGLLAGFIAEAIGFFSESGGVWFMGFFMAFIESFYRVAWIAGGGLGILNRFIYVLWVSTQKNLVEEKAGSKFG